MLLCLNELEEIVYVNGGIQTLTQTLHVRQLTKHIKYFMQYEANCNNIWPRSNAAAFQFGQYISPDYYSIGFEMFLKHLSLL